MSQRDRFTCGPAWGGRIISRVNPQIAILGAGTIGRILAKGLLRAGWVPADLVMADRVSEAVVAAREATGVSALLDPVAAVAGRDVIVVAVKPDDVSRLLGQIAGSVTTDQVVISLAAGVPIAVFEEALERVPVVRCMPNTAAAVGEAMTAFSGGAFTDDGALATTSNILSAIGKTIHVGEDLLDAVTAVSGSGPAYVFLLAEALIEAATREGLPADAADQLVRQTMLGSSLLLSKSEKSVAALRSDVTSPGGTTAAALQVFDEGGLRDIVTSAVRAAAQRSRELGRAAASAVPEVE